MDSRHGLKSLLALLAVATLLGSASSAVAQQTGRIQGRVVNATSGAPLQGAQVFIPGTGLGTLTNAEGSFLLLNVPAGQHEVRVQMLGYRQASQTVSVSAGGRATVNFELQQRAIALDEVVVTGVIGETEAAKVPFAVGKIDAAQMPVPSISAEASIQGKVAGAQVVMGSGQPGEGASVLLRGATSIDTRGRSQEPLYIVDDVIVQGGLADISPQDIESIEVVKGAAAASLYGSRAANGVIRITTKRGQAQEGATYTLRTEYGVSQLPGKIDLAQYHPYRMNESKTAFLDKDGEEFDYYDNDGHTPVLISGNPKNTFQINPWPGKTWDQIDRFFDPGNFVQTHASVSGRRGNTNYYASFGILDEEGVIRGHDGYNRKNFRLNVDHGLSDDLQLSMSTFYSQGVQDEISTDPFFGLTFMPPSADLMKRDPEDYNRVTVKPDPYLNEPNPLYEVLYRDVTDKTSRFMGSGKIRYAPTSWFDIQGVLSYDRTDFNRTDYEPKGYRTPEQPTTGSLEKQNFFEDALNGSVTASFNQTFGDLVARTKLRYSYEQDTYTYFSGSGSGLAVFGVPDLDVVTTGRDLESEQTDVRAESYFFITALDYKDRYVIDLLARRDGSSLFGPEQRWHNYYRGSLAWRLTQEPWWFGPEAISEFKLRGSIGTAGNRPSFFAQYETYSVNAGQVSYATLGNKELKPEHATETELGLDITAFERLNFSLTYANTVTEDQILRVPLPGYAGFEYQWQNAGTLESDTWEASLEAALLERDNFSWVATVLFDRTKSVITELDVPPFQFGPNQQNISAAFYAREGEEYGTFYGNRWATSCDDLPEGVSCDGFEVNDDGYLVWVGDKSYKDHAGPDGIPGTDDDLWLTTSPDGRYQWGMPFYAVDDEGSTYMRIGNTLPDFNLSFSNSINWGPLSLYALVGSSFGFDVYNQTRQWAYRESRGGEIDQADKPQELWKPRAYYSTLYNTASLSDHFVEDGSFVKLRELSLRYTLDNELLSGIGLGGIQSATINLIGRNLYTWTDYTGYDPEVGTADSRGGGSAAIARFDAYYYPNFRTFTAGVEVVF